MCEQGLSLEDNPACLLHEKALPEPVSKRVWEIQACLHLRWDLDYLNHGSEKGSRINYVGFFLFGEMGESTVGLSPLAQYPGSQIPAGSGS